MSLEQQNLERYRQSVEPRRGLVLTAIGVVLGLFAGFLVQALLALALVATRRAGLRSELPFGPALLLGTGLVVLAPLGT
jgi:hypothetical protein